MRRRDFLGLVGGGVAWPIAVCAQRAPMLVVGVLGGAPNNPEGQSRVSIYREALQRLGRIDGRDIRLDIRLMGDDLARVRSNAAELALSNPAMILAVGTPALVALRETTRTIPIVFANVSDPVDGGFVDSEARPGGNITGFTSFEYSVASKWLELLKEISPQISRVLVLLNPDNYTSRGLLRAIQLAGPSAGVQVVAGRVTVANEIAPAIADFARHSNGGIIIAPDALIAGNIGQIVALANQHRLPSIYAFKILPASGGLLSYGTEMTDIFRGAATYTDRILKGEKPSDLPVQNPTRYQLVINLKTANALGIKPPPMMLGRADEVIE